MAAKRRVAIIGGGPAGTACALRLRQGASGSGPDWEVVIFDRKVFLQFGPPGCNMCAGVINETVLQHLEGLGVAVPAELIQRHLEGHHFETRWGGLSMPKEPGATLCTVYRGLGPKGLGYDERRSFDQFLLQKAVERGAQHVQSLVRAVDFPADGRAPLQVHYGEGETLEAEVVIVACGVNSTLPARLEQAGWGYRAPATIHACQAEIPLGEATVTQYFHEIKVFSLGLPGIRLGAITPKREHVTVTVVGRHVKRADLDRFLQHPQVVRHFPPGWQLPAEHCHCHPHLPVTAARCPVTDRCLVIGDAYISRYLKNGIESAFYTGSLAAEAVLQNRLSRAELWQDYVRPCEQRYGRDNLYGRLLFGLNDLITRSRWLTEARLRVLQQEAEAEEWSAKLETRLLWHLFTGSAPYRDIFYQAVRGSWSWRMAQALLAAARPGAGARR